jgi:hypothetical protein
VEDGVVGHRHCLSRLVIQVPRKAAQGNVTYGGCANGMPRNLFMPSDVVPINVPLSSVAVGDSEAISKLANIMGITAQRVKMDDLREPILGDENCLRRKSLQSHFK